MSYDVFISYASEDKDDVALPLAIALRDMGLRVWFDEFELRLGDSLRRTIGNGLVQSKFGVVILSPYFFNKEWPNKELDGLVAKEEGLEKVILPVWHNVDKREIYKFSPLLADKRAANSEFGIKSVAQEVYEVVKESQQPNAGEKETKEKAITVAELERLLSGVAHELNTPLGVVMTANSHLEDETNSLIEAYKNNQLTRSQMQRFIDTTSLSKKILSSNLSRAVQVISTFKNVGPDDSKISCFNLFDYLNTILQYFAKEPNDNKHKINIECDRGLSIESFKQPLGQIIVSLIENSISHAYSENDTGNIVINATKLNNGIQLIYIDDGKGMTEESITNVFEPFYTTARGSSHMGLGMYTLYNLVTMQLNGGVTCISKLGGGVRFTMSFPCKIQ